MFAKPAKENGEVAAVPLACVICRERHLKCDGGTPSCSRCIDSKQKCYYVQSRRGHRPAKKRQHSEDLADKNSETNTGSSSVSAEDYLAQVCSTFKLFEHKLIPQSLALL